MPVLTKKIAVDCMGLIFLWMFQGTAFADTRIIHHQLSVSLDPSNQSMQVTDWVDLRGSRIAEFVLHAGLKPKLTSSGARLVKTGLHSGDVPLEVYRVILDGTQTSFTVSYGGKIVHEFRGRTEGPGRRQQVLAGTISSQGVFLDASVAWFPVMDNVLQTFELNVTLPDGWMAVSQGRGPGVDSSSAGNRVSWHASQPQDDIYLIAGRYHFYSDSSTELQSQVFLREPDNELAQRYLDVTGDYISLYEQLIGKYPYEKFALVENFWETGYGMPSFTLLGPRVIRLPFILHSSYPHEILHNWWGNGVYVDYASGNWSEGLTAYLADHLIKEQRGQGIQHRRNSLQRFADFVSTDNDFPLTDFRSRHSGSSQAVGYDKSMMFFHMLRRKLGDPVFVDGLRRFYVDNLFRRAGFIDLQQAFEGASGGSLERFFEQWTGRESIPSLKVAKSRVTRLVMGFRIDLELWQTQPTDTFELEIPVIIYPADGSEPWRRTLDMKKRAQTFTIDLPGQPLRIDIDPGFDLFRLPDKSETPSTLSRLFGSAQVLFVLPRDARQELQDGYATLARQWSEGYQHASIKYDDELDSLPDNQNIWLMGWENRFVDEFHAGFEAARFSLSAEGPKLVDQKVGGSDYSLVLTRRNDKQLVHGWVGTKRADSLPGLTRKLPHYGKYSYLAFRGSRPDILHKGQWAITSSALKIPLLQDASAVIKELKPVPLWPAPTD